MEKHKSYNRDPNNTIIPRRKIDVVCTKLNPDLVVLLLELNKHLKIGVTKPKIFVEVTKNTKDLQIVCTLLNEDYLYETLVAYDGPFILSDYNNFNVRKYGIL